MRAVTALSVFLATFSASAKASSPPTVDVDLDKYVGRWYQMYADLVLFSTFERGAVCATADYALNDDGTVSVYNNAYIGSPDGPSSNVSGTASATSNPGQFTVTFDDTLSFLGAPYWVVALGEVVDEEYQWAIVSDPWKAGLYVLARDPSSYMDTYDDLVQSTLADLGFDSFYNKPMVLNQTGCTYPEPPQTHTSTSSIKTMMRGVKEACPTVDSVEGLDLVEYTRASWYVQQQQVNAYQPEDELYCVVASYDTDEERSVPFYSGTVVSVHNYATDSNGYTTNNGTILCGRVTDPETPSSLLVAPCFIPNILAGPYLVVGLGVDEATGEYTWAAVSGGQPTVQYDDGCTTRTTGRMSGQGLWILTREKIASDETIAAARQSLSDLGYTLSQLKSVHQEGCTYTGALIKE